MFIYGIIVIVILLIILLYVTKIKQINFVKKKNINKIFKSKNIQNYIKSNNKLILEKRMNSYKYHNYELNCLDFNNLEKIYLKKLINKINKKIKKYKKLNNEWNLIKTRDTLEYGKPFTLDKYIFLPKYVIKLEDIEDTLIHEYIHINQRQNQDRYNKLYEKYLDWYLLKDIEIPEIIKKNMIINPDGPNNNWYFHYKKNKIIPFLIYENGNYNIKYYIIKNNKIMNEYLDNNEISNYLKNKYKIEDNYYHPNEILATILAEKITNNKKIDKNLIHFIN